MNTVSEREAGLSEGARAVLAALRDAPDEYEDHASDYTIWHGIYLDNVRRPDGTTPHEFAGFLSALEQRQLYEQTDGLAFGRVLVGEEPTDDADQ